jgi:hypothetical protein
VWTVVLVDSDADPDLAVHTGDAGSEEQEIGDVAAGEAVARTVVAAW